MTVASDAIGLLPIMWGAGTGSEAMRRIAAPMVGGVLSATLVTLIVIPVLYALVHGRRLPAEAQETRPGGDCAPTPPG
jgi:Cu(I)/Ag(I) efflux system membrane protein CusA/SilA